MKVVITGSLGHIGSRLIHSLKPGSFETVRLIDNLSTQRYPSLFNLPRDVSFHFIQDDICIADLNAYFKGFDVVVHLAAVTDAESSIDQKDLVEATNFAGTERVAKACLENGCRLLFPSTTSVYGSQEQVVDESCPAEGLKPQSPYAESKLRAERLITQLGEDHQLRFVICRFGTIFGPSIGMRFHTAVNKFIWQACLGQAITVWRTAMNQKRPYLDLSDAVNSILFILENDLFDNQIYNIVTANCTVKEVVDTIGRYLKEPEVKYVDSKIMNQLTYTVLSDKFKKTGFCFSGALDQGIGDTIRLLEGIVRKYDPPI
jgi:nucleoside-diphosphate-sugar epimerase